MTRYLLLTLAVLFLFAVTALHTQAPPRGLRVPDGFEVAEFAYSSLANDIYCMTLDPKGRAVVSGRGYVRLLLDDKGDTPTPAGIALLIRDSFRQPGGINYAISSRHRSVYAGVSRPDRVRNRGGR